MHYLYLPTSWCKEQGIKAGSKVTVDRRGSGKLLLSSGMIAKQAQHLEIEPGIDNIDIINKLVVSCFINPTDSFKIKLTKGMDYAELLKQKRIVSVDMVELEGKTLKCESPVSSGSPDLLLKTMISKLTNMLTVMMSDYNAELVQRYEEEIDKSRLLIDKAVIHALTYTGSSTQRIINLHYISLISKELERIADYLITLKSGNKAFFEDILRIIHSLKGIVDLIIVMDQKFDYHAAVDFAVQATSLKKGEAKDQSSYIRLEVAKGFGVISEVLLDWAITKKVT